MNENTKQFIALTCEANAPPVLIPPTVTDSGSTDFSLISGLPPLTVMKTYEKSKIKILNLIIVVLLDVNDFIDCFVLWVCASFMIKRNNYVISQ